MRGAVYLALALTVLSAGNLDARGNFDGIAVTMKSGRDGETFLEGRFRVNASVGTVQTVLSDYDRLPSFVSSVLASRRVGSESGHDVVDQVMTGRIGPFRKKIYLRLKVYRTPTSLSFRDVSGRSFVMYEGSWGIIEQGDDLEIVYELKAKPAFYAPAFLTGNAFRNAVGLFLAEVRNEIESESSQ